MTCWILTMAYFSLFDGIVKLSFQTHALISHVDRFIMQTNVNLYVDTIFHLFHHGQAKMLTSNAALFG